MAKRITSKKQLIQKRNAIIKQVKEAYNEVRKTNPDLPGFYNTKAYKDLNKKRQRSLRRYDKREEINERRREVEAIKKELPKQFENISDVSIYEAFSGKGRIFEDSLIQKHKDGFAFKGVIDYKKKTSYFDNYAEFRRTVNKIIGKLYSARNDSAELFLWQVVRRYSIEDKAVLISYEFYKEYDDNEEEYE